MNSATGALVKRLTQDREVGGSTPPAPTSDFGGSALPLACPPFGTAKGAPSPRSRAPAALSRPVAEAPKAPLPGMGQFASFGAVPVLGGAPGRGLGDLHPPVQHPKGAASGPVLIRRRGAEGWGKQLLVPAKAAAHPPWRCCPPYQPPGPTRRSPPPGRTSKLRRSGSRAELVHCGRRRRPVPKEEPPRRSSTARRKRRSTNCDRQPGRHSRASSPAIGHGLPSPRWPRSRAPEWHPAGFGGPRRWPQAGPKSRPEPRARCRCRS